MNPTFKIHLIFTIAVIGNYSIGITSYAQTIQKLPQEFRIVAKHLAGPLHPSMEAALQYYERDPQNYGTEIDSLVLDFEKIKADNSDINHLISLSLPAAKEYAKLTHDLELLPHLTFSQMAVPFTQDLMTANPFGKAYTIADNRQKVKQGIENQINRAALDILRARYLLPKIAAQYAPKRSNSSSLKVDFHENMPFIPNESVDIFKIANTARDLQDCIFEVKVTGKSGQSVTAIYFIEEWAKDSTLWMVCTPDTRTTTYDVSSIDVNVLSPDMNTTINYIYDQSERGDTYQILYDNVKLSDQPIYSPRSPGIFSDNEPWFRFWLNEGSLSLPAGKCTLTLKNDTQEVSYYKRFNSWSRGRGFFNDITFQFTKQELSFDPNEIVVEISLDNSDFYFREKYGISTNKLLLLERKVSER